MIESIAPALSEEVSADLMPRLHVVALLAMDVDGVLTDGRVTYGPLGEEYKTFNIHDGLGIALGNFAGLHQFFVTSRASGAVVKRAEELGVGVWQRTPDKRLAIERLARQHHIDLAQVAYIGDDLIDLPALRIAGAAFAVANARPEVKAAAHYVTSRAGGDGAVREIIELVLHTQQKWDVAVEAYLAAAREMAKEQNP